MTLMTMKTVCTPTKCRRSSARRRRGGRRRRSGERTIRWERGRDGVQEQGESLDWQGRISVKNSMIVFLGCAVMVLVAAPLYGQTGCTDSPETPAMVLALVGGAVG